MKTLGFGIKSLMKDPQWAMKHGINPFNQTAGSIVGDAKMNNAKPTEGPEQSIFNRAKKGDMNNVNNIFAQNQNRVNGVNAQNDIFSQAKVGGASNKNNNIFEMMNKFDEQHKSLKGAQGVQPMQPQDPMMNSMNDEELKKKMGKKLNIMM